MSSGHEHDRLAAFAEGELDAGEAEAVAAHLEACAVCQAALSAVRRGIALAGELQAEPMPEPIARAMRDRLAGAATRPSRLPWWTAAAVLALIVGAGAFWQFNRPWAQLREATASPTTFEREGRALHEALLAGGQPDYVPADDADGWRWLGEQGAPVAGLLPAHRPDERARFVPVGAAVRSIGTARASVMTYRVDGRPVTVVLANTRDVANPPAAGLLSKRVTHRRDAAGRNVLTWTIGGGTYVMVSELDGYGQRACFVCHTDARFQRTISALSPR
jgi:anti-sigma factor RsiW